jgi:hypothetical protein
MRLGCLQHCLLLIDVQNLVLLLWSSGCATLRFLGCLRAERLSQETQEADFGQLLALQGLHH